MRGLLSAWQDFIISVFLTADFGSNFPVSNDDTVTNPDNGGSGYIKADQLYYFSKEKIDYRVIGYINPDILDLLFEFIEESDFEIVNITDNL